jgi:hypothetical protein
VKNFPVILLAIAVVIELACLAGADPHTDFFAVSIESTELWYNPWPAPGDRAYAANGQCRNSSGVCVPAGSSRTSASSGVRSAF